VYSLLQASDGTLYAGTYPNGNVFKSTDSGTTWTNTGDLSGANWALSLLQASDGTLYAGTGPNGDVFKSTALTVLQGGISSGNWTYVETVADDVHQLALSSGSKTQNDYANWDNIQLLPNLVNNGGMEGGANPPTGWTQETNATVTSDTSPHSGTNCMKVVASAATVGGKQNVTLVSERYYEVSGWIKATSGNSGQIRMDTGAGSLITIGTVTATSWTRVSLRFEAVGTAGVIYCRAVTNGDIVWFDDVAVTEVDQVDASLSALGAGSHFTATTRGKGFHTAADLLVFGAVGNTNQWACVWHGQPQFAYNIEENVTLLEHYFDANNYFRLYYNASTDKFTFRKYVSGAYEATTKAMTFSAEQIISLICTFDTINGSQIYFNGSSAGSTAQSNTTALTTGTTTERDTARVCSSTSIRLASTASASDDYYNGWVVEITGGTGSGQQRVITDYNGTTKVATITNAWTTTPDTTSTYMLYSSKVTLGGTTAGIELANIITEELVIFTHKLTAHEVAAIYERNEPLFNHNGAIKLTATIASDDVVDIDCDDLDIQQWDASAKQNVSLLANGITTNNSRFFQLHPGEDLDDGDIIWCEENSGELEIRYDLRYV
jgi:hypothetical protein